MVCVALGAARRFARCLAAFGACFASTTCLTGISTLITPTTTRFSTNSCTHTGLGLKAAWVGAELFGNASAALQGKSNAATAVDAAAGRVRTLDEVVASIRSDYDLDYFISGAAAMEAYADDCRYSDDFAAFEGPGSTPRFKTNVANLGGLL